MLTRTALVALAALAVLVPAASAQTVVPLAGTGENIEPIARVNIPLVNEIELAGDWAFVSSDGFGSSAGRQEGGLTIVNVKDPTKPFIQGKWDAGMAGLTDADYGDVDLSPDGNLAVLTNAHCSACAEGEVAWVVLIDTTDKRNPKLIGKIVDDATLDYVHTSTIDGDMLYTNPQVAPFFPQPGNAHITAFDISDPANPIKAGTITVPTGDAGLAHDTFVDHRPDGKTLMYAASINKSDVIDITDPVNSNWLQTAISPQYTLSHDVQPNHDRSLIVVDDEGLAGGQLDEGVSACGKVGSGPATLDSGSVHFYEAAEDGTFANEGVAHVGSFNAPTNVNTGACVAHVFWQAPDENRLTQAYYRTGAFILDFEDPANPESLGHFVADGGAKYWSNKPHRGFLYATDSDHGLDILRYTGEGGTRWPATAGPAEVQRSARQGVPYVPIAGVDPAAPVTPDAPAQPGTTAPDAGTPAAPATQAQSGSTAQPGGTPAAGSPATGAPATTTAARALGRFSFKTAVARVPGRKGRSTALTLTFTDAKGRPVGRRALRRAAARKATVSARGVAVAGRYRWTLKSGKRVLRRGSFTVKATKGLALSPGATLAATVK